MFSVSKYLMGKRTVPVHFTYFRENFGHIYLDSEPDLNPDPHSSNGLDLDPDPHIYNPDPHIYNPDPKHYRYC
jgi:hypothetical protein